MNSRLRVHLIAIIRGDRVLFGDAVGEKLQRNDVLILAGKDRGLRSLGHSHGS